MHNKIQSLWIGNNLSNNETLCLKSYLAHNKNFYLYTYEQIQNVPTGVTILDANSIIKESEVFKDSAGSYASFADWFRAKMLYINGGWWVDMDSVCLQKFDFTQDYCISSERSRISGQQNINNGFLKFPAGDKVIERLLLNIERRISENEIIEWGTLGIFLFNRIINLYPELFQYIAKPEVFCPLDHFDLSSLICKSEVEFTRETYTVHLWNEIWKRGELSKNCTYHPESVYERLKEKYL
ncbi:glycosyltransferase [Sphingobacterium sp. UBA6320]|jgi:mannosyltransferase OCH1-like enzyme|uniref:glycosyltransferase n=1 Tax=Sphingobacterium sp. UBA6320 TaxID=1947510 RepID=UPI0025E9C690|nr:glycosyltransferase [Sphingobacterium sp. UBA6320]